ncbi:hypothetical protein GCM10009835_42990 [Planosporangium flavigriseum]|uniref:DNA-binding domain-containing protein n=2 Tax=Planosporangium flavigriseum TaxID=373681 RepID=A0A8J3PM97_9ACTN|nr:hypothetical protein Pfl04_30910 [Planosporangium flavigriseum]
MRRHHAYYGDGSTILVSEVHEGFFDEEDSVVGAVAFELHDNALSLDITLVVDDFDDEDELRGRLSSCLAPLLRRHRMMFQSAWQDPNYAAPPWPWHVRVAVNARGRDLADLFELGQDMAQLAEAMTDGQLTRATAGDLVRGGHAHLLIGQPEGHWLDVKSQHYDLAGDHGQISLAQAVARFCNAEAGGLVVVGMSSKKVPGGEEIRGLCPVPRDNRMVRRYQQTLERRLFPPPDDLTIEAIPMGEDMIMLIEVPPQPEELKPFLVHGAIVDGRIEGAFISIVRRRGESSIPITAPMIHSTLAAGRGLLRRGEIPSKGA